MTLRYSTVKSAFEKLTTQHAEPWTAFAQRLLTHTITPNKEDVALFCPAVFNRSGRQELSNVEEISVLVLDFDNSVKVLDADGKPVKDANGKQIKTIAPVVVDMSDIEAVLSGFELVVTTTHNHTDVWPRFRVILPLESPITLPLWHPFIEQVTTSLGLTAFDGNLDPCYKVASQGYYWPSAAAGSPKYAAHHAGKFLTFDQATANTNSAARKHKTDGRLSPFTYEQICAYWLNEDPDVEQSDHSDEWRYNCGIHGGDSYKLYVNPEKGGTWYCQSGCDFPNKGGDIYKYHMLKHKMTFPEAKAAVHTITGPPANVHTPEELTEIIKESDISQTNAIAQAIAKQARKVQTQLKNQLITTHPTLNKADVAEAVKLASNIVPFERNGEPVLDLDPVDADEYGLRLARDRYIIDSFGVHLMAYDRTAKDIIKQSPPIADRPIWPSAIGLDMATEATYLQVSWIGSKGRLHAEWFPENILRDKVALCKLDDSPISLDSLVRISGFLTYAKTTIADVEMSRLSSTTGWCGDELNRRFVLPGDPEIGYIGPDLKRRGSVAGWADGLKTILGLGRDGYRALAMVGLSAGAPLVELADKRNPVVGLIHETSMGKNKAIEFALSMWDDHKAMTINMVSSTTKGTQDKTKEKAGLPIFLDELQQLYKQDPLKLEAVVYNQANGLDRVLSGKNRKATGGERRFGMTLFAAEDEVMYALQKGAQNRSICLIGDKAPLVDIKTSDKVEYATANNCGHVGRALIDILNEFVLENLLELQLGAQRIKTAGGLVGDDHHVIAIAVQGLSLLMEATGIKIPLDDFEKWFVAQVQLNRQNMKTAADVAFVQLIETLSGMKWGNGGVKDVLEDPNGGIAWRGMIANGRADDTCPLEINPTHPVIVQFMQTRNIKESSTAGEWAKYGWLRKQGPHLKWDRSTIAKHSPGARVWRITQAGIAATQLNVVGEDADHADAE